MLCIIPATREDEANAKSHTYPLEPSNLHTQFTHLILMM